MIAIEGIKLITRACYIRASSITYPKYEIIHGSLNGNTGDMDEASIVTQERSV